VRQRYRAACRAFTKRINDSRSNFLSEKLKAEIYIYRTLLHINNKNNNSSASPGLGHNAISFCHNLALFFQDKINKLRTANISFSQHSTHNPFSHDSPHTGNPLYSFAPVTPQEVSKLLSSLSLQFSPLDAFSSSLIKQCPRAFSAIISSLANLSFSHGHFPTDYKIAQITPLLKKPNLNPDDLSNYRPISNLHTLSKILERLALSSCLYQPTNPE